ARRAEDRELLPREIVLPQKPVAQRVVDVVVDVGDAIHEADDLALERLRLPFSGVGEDSVTDLVREVDAEGDAMRLLVVPEASSETLVQRVVQRILPGMAERRVPGVVPESDRLDQVLVQP